MHTKLRQVGNSVGLTIPASELKRIGAKAGDIIDLKINKVIRHARSGWHDSSRWLGAKDAPLLLDSEQSTFDNEDWQW